MSKSKIKTETKLDLTTAITASLFRLYNEWTCGTQELIDRTIKNNENAIVKPPLLSRINHQIKKIKIFGYDCWVITPRWTKSEHCFMYVHGGGFIMEITLFHWLFIAKLVNKTRCTAFVPIFPLSKKDYSSILDDIKCLLGTYQYILNSYRNDQISIIGDSAGGCLTLVIGQQIKKEKLPPPKNLICLSPLVDSAHTEHELAEGSEKDAVLPYALLSTAAVYHIPPKADVRNYIYSPINGDFKNIGTVTIFIGTKEAFYEQNLQLHNKLDKLHIKHNFFVGEGLFHVWPLFAIPPSKIAIAQIAALLK